MSFSSMITLVALILTATIGSVAAQDPAQGAWSGALSGGYATGVDNSDFSHGSGSMALGVFGGGGGNHKFGAELGYDHHENWSEVVDGINTIEYDRSAWHLTAMLRLRSTSGSVRPFGLAGLGVYALSQDGEDFLAPGLNLGTGLEFHPGHGPLGISAGARFHLAGRPLDDKVGGDGFLALLLGVTYR